MKNTGASRTSWARAAMSGQAKLDAFGAKLMPILQEMGIEAKPTVSEIYNIIKGQ